MAPGQAFTGRAAELAFLAEHVSRSGSGAVLVGGAGVGKTRLAVEAARRSARHGLTVRRVGATASSQSLPFGALAPLLPAAMGMTPDFSILTKAAELLAPGAGRDTAIVVDDAHLLDPLSASLLLHLAMTGRASLLVTVRAGEACPDAVAALWKDGHVRRLDIGPLAEAETAELVEKVVGGPVQRHTQTRLWQLTSGNPLFIHNVVGAALAAGTLAPVGGVWRWRGPLSVTPRLAEVVAERLDGLDPAVYSVVEAVAYGEPIGVGMLSGFAEAGAIEEAERAGLIAVRVQGRRVEARLDHPLYGEAVRARTPKLAERRLSGRLAQAIAAAGGRRSGDTLRWAKFALESDVPPDPARFTEAAGRAIGLYELEFAVRCARSALRAGGPVEASILLGMALSWLDRPEESEAAMAADVARAVTGEQIMTMAFTRAANLNWVAARPEQAEQVLAEARGRLEAPPLRAVLDAFGAAFAVQRGEVGKALATVERLLAAPDDCPPVAALFAELAGVEALGALGRADEIASHMAHGHAALDLVPQMGIMRHSLGTVHTNGLIMAGYLEEAERVVAFHRGHTEPAAVLSGSILMQGYHTTSFLQSHVALERGRLRTAIRLGKDAVAGFEEEDPGGLAFLAALILCQAVAATGDAAATAAVYADVERHYRPVTQTLRAAVVVLCRAWVAAAAGTPSRGRALAREAAEVAARMGHPAMEMVASHTAVRFGDRGMSARLAALAERVDGPRAALAARHAAAFAAADDSALIAVSEDFELMGALVIAAEASAQATTIRRERGDLRSEQAALLRTRRLIELCEAPDTPALREALRPFPLTEREREVAMLVASGLANRQIAERLVVSVRTVEGHVYRACMKLGVPDRAALGALVGIGFDQQDR